MSKYIDIFKNLTQASTKKSFIQRIIGFLFSKPVGTVDDGLSSALGEMKKEILDLQNVQQSMKGYLATMRRLQAQCEIPYTKGYDPRFSTACDIRQDIKQLLANGTIFPHPVGIVISAKAEIGGNCQIWQNVTIGAKSVEAAREEKYPKIGDGVMIYAGAVIVGDITIENYSVIAANSFVNKSVPPYTIVAGAPAKKIGINAEKAEENRSIEMALYANHLEVLRNSKLASTITEGSICIDCGANVGDITDIFACAGATVFSFEPHPLCFEELKKRFANNNKVVLFNQGVFDKNTTMKLYKSNMEQFGNLFYSQGSSVFSTKNNIDTDSYDEITLIDIVDFIKDIDGEIEILKLDVEGAEFCILERMIHEKIYTKIKRILVETHEDRIPEIRNNARRVRMLIQAHHITNIELDWS